MLRSGGMATLAASNVAGVLTGKPVLAQGSNTLPFVDVRQHPPLKSRPCAEPPLPAVCWCGASLAPPPPAARDADAAGVAGAQRHAQHRQLHGAGHADEVDYVAPTILIIDHWILA
jgi:hypothetical protein